MAIDRILRLPEVEQATGFKRSCIYAMEARGEFPKRITLSKRAVGWRESEVAMWIVNKIKHSRPIPPVRKDLH